MWFLSEIRNTILGKCGKRLASSNSAPNPGAEHLCSASSFNTILAPILVGCELPVKAGGTRRAIWWHSPRRTNHTRQESEWGETCRFQLPWGFCRNPHGRFPTSYHTAAEASSDPCTRRCSRGIRGNVSWLLHRKRQRKSSSQLAVTGSEEAWLPPEKRDKKVWCLWIWKYHLLWVNEDKVSPWNCRALRLLRFINQSRDALCTACSYRCIFVQNLVNEALSSNWFWWKAVGCCSESSAGFKVGSFCCNKTKKNLWDHTLIQSKKYC